MDEFLKQLTGKHLPNIVFALVILIIGWWITTLMCKIVQKALVKSSVDNAVISFIMSFVKIALRFILILSVLSTIGINVTSIITAVGAAAVTVGLALQASMSNIASGVLIIINKPFKSGDVLEFEGLTGTVLKIELFSTYLVTGDNKEIIIPNSRLTNNNVVNVTTNDSRRLDLSYSISYKDDILKVKGLLLTLMADYPLIKKDPEPVICVGKHDASGVEIIVRAWVNTEDYGDTYHYMQENVKNLFDKNNITIPFEQIVIHKQ